MNIGPTLAIESTKRSSNNINTYLNNIQNNFPVFRFSNIPVKNFALTLKNLKVSKSTGLDKIPAKVLKIASSIIAPSLTFIFNLSLSSGGQDSEIFTTFSKQISLERFQSLDKSSEM